MTRARMKQAKAAAALLAWGVLPSAWAGVPVVPGAIVYAPLSSAAPVPTLGEWSLTLMALLLAVVAYRVLRGRVNGRLMTPLLLTGGLAAAGLAGHDLVGLAQAVVPQVQFSQAAGGSVGVGVGETQIINTSGVPQQVTSMSTQPGYSFVTPPGSPQCQVGTPVAPSGISYVEISSPVE